MFTRVRHSSLSWTRLVHSTPSNHILLDPFYYHPPIYMYVCFLQASPSKIVTTTSSPSLVLYTPPNSTRRFEGVHWIRHRCINLAFFKQYWNETLKLLLRKKKHATFFCRVCARHVQWTPGIYNKTANVLSRGCESYPNVALFFRQAANYRLPRFSVLPHKYAIHVRQPRTLVMTDQSIAVVDATRCLVWRPCVSRGRGRVRSRTRIHSQ
jgi:hypothetical protein